MKLLTFPKFSLTHQLKSLSHVQISQDFSAEKKIFYTYIANNGFKQDQFEMGLSYFDPKELKYKEVKLSIPPLEILGTKIPTPLPDDKIDEVNQDSKGMMPNLGEKNQLRAIYSFSNFFIYYEREIFIVLFFFASYLLYLQVYKKRKQVIKVEKVGFEVLDFKNLFFPDLAVELIKFTGKNDIKHAINTLALEDSIALSCS